MMNYKVNDRVIHDYLGKAIVKRIVRSMVNGDIVAYIISVDKKPPKKYNMGNLNCLAWPDDLELDID